MINMFIWYTCTVKVSRLKKQVPYMKIYIRQIFIAISAKLKNLYVKNKVNMHICQSLESIFTYVPFLKTFILRSILYGKLIFDKRARTVQWKKDSLFNKWCWKIGYAHVKTETGLLFYITHKNELKQIKDLNIRPQTIKLLAEKIGKSLLEILAMTFEYDT